MEDFASAILRTLNVDLKPSDARLVALPDRCDEVLYPGAHIATGVDGPGNQYHHGIVLDIIGRIDIVHFWGPGDKTTAKIVPTTLASFVAGDPQYAGRVARPLYLISYDHDSEQKRRETVERATALLRNADQIEYNLIHSNCECFAAYCRTGMWVSKQVHKAINALIERSIPVIKDHLTRHVLLSRFFLVSIMNF